MRSIIFAAITFVPALAFAQAPVDPNAPPPPPAGAPAEPPPPPLGIGSGVLFYYQPQPQPAYIQPTGPVGPWATHQGVTFEANLGLGFAHLTDDNSNMTLNTDGALAGVDLGVGGWLTRQLALTGRVAGVNIKYMGTENIEGNLVLAWIGPSLQYWPDPHFWVGGGVGFATYRLVGNSQCGTNGGDCGVNGFGFDLRAGYSFGDTQLTFNVSVELNPSHLSDNSTGGTTNGGTGTAVAFLAGYQYL